MEKRKETLSALKMCRFCLCQDNSLSCLYEGNQKSSKSVSLPLKIMSCLSIEVFPSDRMPTYICNRCSLFVELFHDYKQLCRTADQRILHYIQSGTALEPAIWPESLSKVFCFAFKTLKRQHIVKTVVEGGATVQVTSHDGSNSDEEEDEENVYNIKIGDAADGSKCIKVTSKNDDSKEVMKTNRKDDSQQIGKPSIRSFDDGCWPCDECDCTYSLQQLLELHKKQKHRERTVNCDQCDAKFFTKYDLMTHSWRHSDETPFQCVACDRKFKRLVLLKRHEKIIHSDIPQLSCPSCPATFLSIEELQAHEKRHIRNALRPHACPKCSKKFHEKNSLMRHIDLVHYKKATFSCEYCPEQFTSITKLARHVRSHAGERPHPCKYCEKSFMKSHHYTRHLRLKHRDNIRSSRGHVDNYRCEQCEETFTTQDELIYHSAIHATQNLTCPLCQEKFENVEAVTAHIKSHVNDAVTVFIKSKASGIEFMCDLCELVFTTKEKLDNHLTVAHADEITEELGQDESSMELDEDEFEDDNGINLKEEDGEMVVEIKKTSDFMTQVESEEKPENTNSEESEVEATYTELATVDTLAIVHKDVKVKPEPEKSQSQASQPQEAVKPAPVVIPPATVSNSDNQTASILRKAEEVKRKVQLSSSDVAEKKVKTNKAESSTAVVGASDKSLRLLEKELQELKRTNTRNEATKTPAKPVETIRNRRPQLYTSTPKTRATEEKKAVLTNKTQTVEKKVIERRAVTKENKEPKETKEVRQNVVAAKEDNKDNIKEKEVKEKEPPKTIVKNGTGDKSQPEETIRRSTRPSKIKDYAKMIRDKSQDSIDEDDSDDDYDDSKDSDKLEVQTRAKPKRASVKTPPAAKPPAAATPTPAPTVARKRGRPRKEPKEVPSKIKKDDIEGEAPEGTKEDKSEMDDSVNKSKEILTDDKEKEAEVAPQEPQPAVADKPDASGAKTPPSADQKAAGSQIMSPTGQTLKKVPIKAIPPGIKPLPLPVRPMGTGELCEMQIGKKVVKVQKIVMTKAEVEAMAKKGLVEMKDGTMVLKQGIKLSSSEGLKSTLIADKDPSKEFPSKADVPSASHSNASESI